MLRYHMLVVTRDNGLKRAIKRVTTATGSTADFVTEAGQAAARPFDLAIFDARSELPDRAFLEAVPPRVKILYVIAESALLDRLALLSDPRAVSLLCHDERFDDDEFISSATKALRSELFGLQTSCLNHVHSAVTQIVGGRVQRAQVVLARGEIVVHSERVVNHARRLFQLSDTRRSSCQSSFQ